MLRQPGLDDGLQSLGIGEVDTEQDEVIHIAAVMADFQDALDEVIQRVQVDQRIQLAQQVADRDADRLSVVGKQHHQIHKAAILDLALDQGMQNGPLNPIKEFANIQL